MENLNFSKTSISKDLVKWIKLT